MLIAKSNGNNSVFSEEDVSNWETGAAQGAYMRKRRELRTRPVLGLRRLGGDAATLSNTTPGFVTAVPSSPQSPGQAGYMRYPDEGQPGRKEGTDGR